MQLHVVGYDDCVVIWVQLTRNSCSNVHVKHSVGRVCWADSEVLLLQSYQQLIQFLHADNDATASRPFSGGGALIQNMASSQLLYV